MSKRMYNKGFYPFVNANHYVPFFDVNDDFNIEFDNKSTRLINNNNKPASILAKNFYELDNVYYMEFIKDSLDTEFKFTITRNNFEIDEEKTRWADFDPSTFSKDPYNFAIDSNGVVTTVQGKEVKYEIDFKSARKIAFVFDTTSGNFTAYTWPDNYQLYQYEPSRNHGLLYRDTILREYIFNLSIELNKGSITFEHDIYENKFWY